MRRRTSSTMLKFRLMLIIFAHFVGLLASLHRTPRNTCACQLGALIRLKTAVIHNTHQLPVCSRSYLLPYRPDNRRIPPHQWHSRSYRESTACTHCSAHPPARASRARWGTVTSIFEGAARVTTTKREVIWLCTLKKTTFELFEKKKEIQKTQSHHKNNQSFEINRYFTGMMPQ